MIPKIIHQTYSDKSKIPAIFRSNIEELICRNPDWEYRFYDDEGRASFILNEYGEDMLCLDRRIDSRYGAARADFFRYLLLYRVGGVYLDIKSTVVGRLSSVIGDDVSYLISQWDNGPNGREKGAGIHPKYGVDSEYQQWFIVAEKGHPYLAAVIDRVCHNIRNYNALESRVGMSGVLRTTGPIAYTLAIKPILDMHSHEIVDIYNLGFRYTCIPNDVGGSQHRKMIPSYRDIRFPIVKLDSNSSFSAKFWQVVAVLIAVLHEASKWGGIQAKIVGLKRKIKGRPVA